MFFMLQFPTHIFSIYPFLASSFINSKIILHIHNLPLVAIKVNNFLSHMLTYKFNFYKRIKTNHSKQIYLVNKSNKKKREQKGLGMARVGSLKSSLNRGGGVIFGPKPHLSKLKINTKEWVCVYKSFLIIKRRHIGWVFINKSLIYNNKIDCIKNFIHHLGISIVERIIFLIFTKHILYTQICFTKFRFSNINLVNFLNSKYIICLF